MSANNKIQPISAKGVVDHENNQKTQDVDLQNQQHQNLSPVLRNNEETKKHVSSLNTSTSPTKNKNSRNNNNNNDNTTSGDDENADHDDEDNDSRRQREEATSSSSSPANRKEPSLLELHSTVIKHVIRNLNYVNKVPTENRHKNDITNDNNKNKSSNQSAKTNNNNDNNNTNNGTTIGVGRKSNDTDKNSLAATTTTTAAASGKSMNTTTHHHHHVGAGSESIRHHHHPQQQQQQKGVSNTKNNNNSNDVDAANNNDKETLLFSPHPASSSSTTTAAASRSMFSEFSPSPRSSIDDFELVKQIGKGNFGEVFLCYWNRELQLSRYVRQIQRLEGGTTSVWKRYRRAPRQRKTGGEGPPTGGCTHNKNHHHHSDEEEDTKTGVNQQEFRESATTSGAAKNKNKNDPVLIVASPQTTKASPDGKKRDSKGVNNNNTTFGGSPSPASTTELLLLQQAQKQQQLALLSHDANSTDDNNKDFNNTATATADTTTTNTFVAAQQSSKNPSLNSKQKDHETTNTNNTSINFDTDGSSVVVPPGGDVFTLSSTSPEIVIRGKPYPRETIFVCKVEKIPDDTREETEYAQKIQHEAGIHPSYDLKRKFTDVSEAVDGECLKKVLNQEKQQNKKKKKAPYAVVEVGHYNSDSVNDHANNNNYNDLDDHSASVARIVTRKKAIGAASVNETEDDVDGSTDDQHHNTSESGSSAAAVMKKTGQEETSQNNNDNSTNHNIKSNSSRSIATTTATTTTTGKNAIVPRTILTPADNCLVHNLSYSRGQSSRNNNNNNNNNNNSDTNQGSSRSSPTSAVLGRSHSSHGISTMSGGGAGTHDEADCEEYRQYLEEDLKKKRDHEACFHQYRRRSTVTTTTNSDPTSNNNISMNNNNDQCSTTPGTLVLQPSTISSPDHNNRKIMTLAAASGAERALNMKQEAFLLANCAHPNLVSFIDYFIKRDKQYLVLEYVDGCDLEKELLYKRSKNTFLSETSVAFVAVQIALAIEYLHRHNILHRDLKAANVLLSKKWLVKLTDFGTAAAFDCDVDQAVNFSSAGTPLYLAPEIYKGRPASEKADIYSMGVILYFTLELDFPYFSPTTHELRQKVLYGQPRSFKRQNVSLSMLEAIQSLLQRDPARRPTALEFLQTPVMQKALDRYVKTLDQKAVGTPLDRVWYRVVAEHAAIIEECAERGHSSQRSRRSSSHSRNEQIRSVSSVRRP